MFLLSFAGAATGTAVGRMGLGIELIKAAQKPPPPSLWDRAWPWLVRLGLTLKLILSPGLVHMGRRPSSEMSAA